MTKRMLLSVRLVVVLAVSLVCFGCATRPSRSATEIDARLQRVFDGEYNFRTDERESVSHAVQDVEQRLCQLAKPLLEKNGKLTGEEWRKLIGILEAMEDFGGGSETIGLLARHLSLRPEWPLLQRGQDPPLWEEYPCVKTLVAIDGGSLSEVVSLIERGPDPQSLKAARLAIEGIMDRHAACIAYDQPGRLVLARKHFEGLLEMETDALRRTVWEQEIKHFAGLEKAARMRLK